MYYICIICLEIKIKLLGLMFLNGFIKLINEYKEDFKLLLMVYLVVGKFFSWMLYLFIKDIVFV